MLRQALLNTFIALSCGKFSFEILSTILLGQCEQMLFFLMAPQKFISAAQSIILEIPAKGNGGLD